MRAFESAAAVVNGSGIDFLRRGQYRQGISLIAGFTQFRFRGLIRLREHEGIAFADELPFVLLAAAFGGDAIGEIGFSPARRGLDAVERGHGTACSQIRAGFAVIDLHLGEREDVVVAPFGELHRSDTHKATRDAVIACGAAFKRLQAGIGEIIHEGGVVLPPHECDAGLEGGIIADLDFESHREAETTADLAKVVVTGLQHDALDLHALAEIDLHPLHGILRGRNGAVIAEIRFRIRIRTFLRRAVDALAERGVGCTGFFLQRLLQGRDGVRDLLLLLLKRGELLHRRVIRVVIDVGAVDAGEDGVQRVVVLLRDGIEFVIVALRTLHGEAAHGADGVLHHVIAIEMPGDFAIELRLRHLRMADVIPRPCGDEPKRRNAIHRARIERISGDLLLDEAGVGFVAVQRPDDVVAVRPSIQARLVFVVAVGFAVMHGIQPVPRPALAVAGRGEEHVHESFILLIGQISQIGRIRRQAREIEVEAADQRAGIGAWSGREALFLQLFVNEGIHALALGFGERFEGPPVRFVLQLRHIHAIGPVCAVVDPAFQRIELRGAQFRLRRHGRVFFQAADETEKLAFRALPRRDVLQSHRLDIEPVIVLLFFSAVALVAVLFEDRLHFAHEIHREGGRGAGDEEANRTHDLSYGIRSLISYDVHSMAAPCRSPDRDYRT